MQVEGSKKSTAVLNFRLFTFGDFYWVLKHFDHFGIFLGGRGKNLQSGNFLVIFRTINWPFPKHYTPCDQSKRNRAKHISIFKHKFGNPAPLKVDTKEAIPALGSVPQK
eukprot:5267551-Amphidinium_carterae.1